jgi:hypothetical protein
MSSGKKKNINLGRPVGTLKNRPIREGSHMHIVKQEGTRKADGTLVITVNSYGFKRLYNNEISAAKAIGCDHNAMMDKLSRSRDGMVFVYTRNGEVTYA